VATKQLKYCNVCGKATIQSAGKGREKLYCSDACRQKAKRERYKDEFTEIKQQGGQMQEKVKEMRKENEQLQVQMISTTDMFKMLLNISVISCIASDFLKKNGNTVSPANKKIWNEYVKLRDSGIKMQQTFNKIYGQEVKRLYGNKNDSMGEAFDDAFRSIGINTQEKAIKYIEEMKPMFI
jgi:DNA-binding protein YbaB